MEDNNNKENKINIELPENVADGVYSNLAVITHSQSEFVCDFVQIMPGVPKGKVNSRVIMTPENAKRLLNALHDNIQKYEANAGKISDNNNDVPPINFGTPPTEA
ncbi:DUF3467 domain-containing protein [Brumimicrobium salinarum]|uniref:DUF3467 domain-containing protein n=1 Tax=Brumimicrobium salinarum TaxID=2058658 RepID=A0A2I0R0G5_9FLAO|nr:DUF3467 domain-containing protein [Brumimicrobium salinarum]PKR80078.1 DUF3467 domain-containing protein [Brumimicrobium salinarum]